MEDPGQRCLEDDNLPVLERSASSTPLSFSQRALAMLTGFLMALPLWTNYIIGGDLSSDDDKYTYVVTLLALVFPILAFLRNATMNGILMRGMLSFLLILIGPLILSIVINITHYSYIDLMTCVVRITALVMFFTLITTIEMNVQAHRILRMVILTVSCSLALLFVFASIVTPVWYWGRFAPNDMQPNWWGEVLFVVVFGGAFTSKMVLRYGLWALALVGLVLVQSRGNLLAAVLLITVVTLARMRSRTVIAVGVACCTIGIMLDVFVFETRLSSAAQDFVAEDVLLLNDPYRGLGTGASGRDITLDFGLELFVEHPLAGVGFGRSGGLASEAVGLGIHNGYVALLAELGAPLFAILAIIMIGAVWLSFARKDWESLGMIVSFMGVLLMVTPRAINMSLPTMIFWAFVARSWILPLRP